MQLLKVTIDRRTGKRIGEEIVGQVPDDPHYWEPICDLLLNRMIGDGIIPPYVAPALQLQDTTGRVDITTI